MVNRKCSLRLIKYGLAISLVLTTRGLLKAQVRSFSNGYIITLEGDTINGIVSKAHPHDQNTLIQFKESEDGEVEKLTPQSIRGYSIFKNHKIFISLALPKIKLEDKEDSTSTFFLEALVRGKVSLYRYEDDKSVTRYFLSKDDKLLELRYHKKEIKTQQGKIEIGETSFIGVCNLFMGDCDAKKYNFTFSEFEIVNKVQQYNRCTTIHGVEKNPATFRHPAVPNFKFATATLITKKGDTIKGWVGYFSERELNVMARFRRSLGEKDELFKPPELKLFQLGDGARQFEPIMNLEYYPNRKSNDREIIASAFVEIIVKGKATLFRLKDNIDQEHYFIAKENKVYELRWMEREIDGKIFRDRLYNGILNIVLGDCGSTSFAIEFQRANLIRAVVEYNDCAHSKSIIFDKRNYSSRVKHLQE